MKDPDIVTWSSNTATLHFFHSSLPRARGITRLCVAANSPEDLLIFEFSAAVMADVIAGYAEYKLTLQREAQVSMLADENSGVVTGRVVIKVHT